MCDTVFYHKMKSNSITVCRRRHESSEARRHKNKGETVDGCKVFKCTEFSLGLMHQYQIYLGAGGWFQRRRQK